MLNRFRAIGVSVVGLVIGAVVVLAAPAWAHVSISPGSAPKGSDAVLSFNVPNESEDASTTEVAIVFPPDHPIAEAAVLPIAGWTATVATAKADQPIQTDEGEVTEAVSRVTWTGGKIDPGQFQQFTVSVGLPDDTDELVFKALQTYSDGTKVSWIEEETPGGAEPEHPAPVLTLTEAANATPSTTAPATTNTTPAAKDLAKQSDVDSAKTLGVLGLIVGALGLIAAIGAFAIKRRA